MRTIITLAAATAALAAAGCGGGSGDPGARQPDDQAELDFARCMREHGIPFAERKVAGGATAHEVRIGPGVSPQRVQATTQECRKKTGGGPRPLSRADQERFRDAALRFARCMREHGVDVPDPQTGGEGGIVIGGPKGSSVDPRSPAFQTAEKACKGLLPKGKGGPQTSVSGTGGAK